MKKLTILSIVLIAASTAIGQKMQASGALIKAFKDQFPASEGVKWEYDKKEKVWEADFKMNDLEYSAEFGDDGKWIETERDISRDELPMAVDTILKDLIANKYPDSEIEEIEWIETEKGIFYEVDLDVVEKQIMQDTGDVLSKEEYEVELIFAQKGKLLEENKSEKEKAKQKKKKVKID